MTFAFVTIMPKVRSSCLRNKSDEKKGETDNLFALLGTVVGLVPSLVEGTGLARALRDLVLLEVITANA